MLDKRQIVRDGVRGALNGATLGAAGSILSGAAVVTVPVYFLGLIAIGTSTVVAGPVVAGVAAGGAALGGVAGAFRSYRRQKRIEATFQDLAGGGSGGDAAPGQDGHVR